jgi:uncharacterized small protein (DUF1192 family)
MSETLFQFEPRNCVLCGCLCQPAPTNRGWVYVDNEAFRGGVHYDCLYHWWDNVRASGEPDAVVDALQAEIARLREEEQRNALFEKCLHRALKLWQERHPEANHWPDGADNIAWLIDEIERLRAEPHWCEVCQKPIAARSNAEIIDRLRAENERLQERLSLIYGLTYDRDGMVTAEGLGELVDTVCQIAQGEYALDPGTPPEQLRGEQ